MHNTVTVHIDKKLVPERYAVGTLFEVDERSDGMPSGIYMLVASGQEGYVVLVNLGTGGTRNGFIHQEQGRYSVAESDLQKNIGGPATTYRVVHSVTITAEDLSDRL